MSKIVSFGRYLYAAGRIVARGPCAAHRRSSCVTMSVVVLFTIAWQKASMLVLFITVQWSAFA